MKVLLRNPKREYVRMLAQLRKTALVRCLHRLVNTRLLRGALALAGAARVPGLAEEVSGLLRQPGPPGAIVRQRALLEVVVGQGGDGGVYISSADWMTRNLEKRVELMIPIEEPTLKRRLVRILDAYFQDNTQASRLMPDGTSQRIVRAKGQKAFRVQDYFYQSARKAAKAREHERAMTFEPHVPAE